MNKIIVFYFISCIIGVIHQQASTENIPQNVTSQTVTWDAQRKPQSQGGNSTPTPLTISSSSPKDIEKPGKEKSPTLSSEIPKTDPACLPNEVGTYECSGPGGHIKVEMGHHVYNLTTKDNEQVIVFVWTDKGLGEGCHVRVGDVLYDRPMSLQDPTNPVVTSNVSVVVDVTQNDADCSWNVFYRKAYTYSGTFTLEEPQGTIASLEDPDGIQKYRPRSNLTWVLNPVFNQCSMTFNVTTLDLGTAIPESKGAENLLDMTKRDYVIIRKGPEGNQTDSSMVQFLTGRMETPRIFTIDSCSVSVEFVSNMHYQNVSGFEIQYTVVDTTSELSTKEIPRRSEKLSTWVALNGVTIQHETLMNDIVRLFKKSIASMANEYWIIKQYPKLDFNITVKDVLVADVGSCNYFYCRLDCTAFHFLIDVQSGNNSWLFNETKLQDMLYMQQLQPYWNFENCLVCNETPDLTWGYPIVFMTFVMMFGMALMLFAVCTKEPPRNDKRRNNLQDILHGWDRDATRRSVSEASQSTNNSRSSLVSKKFTLPSMKKKETFKDPEGIQYDVSEFKHFKSQETSVDPTTLGLDEDLFAKKQAVTFFSNEAFNEEEESDVYHQSQPTNQSAASNNSVPQIEAYQTAFGRFG